MRNMARCAGNDKMRNKQWTTLQQILISRIVLQVCRENKKARKIFRAFVLDSEAAVIYWV